MRMKYNCIQNTRACYWSRATLTGRKYVGRAVYIGLNTTHSFSVITYLHNRAFSMEHIRLNTIIMCDESCSFTVNLAMQQRILLELGPCSYVHWLARAINQSACSYHVSISLLNASSWLTWPPFIIWAYSSSKDNQHIWLELDVTRQHCFYHSLYSILYNFWTFCTFIMC